MLVSSGAREWFECVIEGEQEFSHHCGEGELMGCAFGAQTLVKAREDWIVTRGGKRGHVEPAAQSTSSAEDGAFTAERTAVVIKRRQAGERSSLPPIELAELGHLRE